MNYYGTEETSFLSHHGILGQKWGVRRYQNADGTLTSAGKKRYSTATAEQEHYQNFIKDPKVYTKYVKDALDNDFAFSSKEKKSIMKELETEGYNAIRGGHLDGQAFARYKIDHPVPERTEYNKYEQKAERRKEKSAAAAKAHIMALESGDRKLAGKTEKKALKELNKYLNAEDKAAGYDAFEAYNSNKKHLQTESKIRRLHSKNYDGRYDQKLQQLTDKSYMHKKAAESSQWKSIGRRASAEQIARNAGASGYTVRQIRTSRSFQTGGQRLALLLGVYARTTVPATYYKVRR